MNNYQRAGSASNTQVGNTFEGLVGQYFSQIGIPLASDFSLPVGVATIKKQHAFDLGSSQSKIIVECKSHTWTSGGNTPSAKMTTWNEAMYYFLAAPREYRKILVVLRDFSPKRAQTLATYYIRTYNHMIPPGVEIWEYDMKTMSASRIY